MRVSRYRAADAGQRNATSQPLRVVCFTFSRGKDLPVQRLVHQSTCFHSALDQLEPESSEVPFLAMRTSPDSLAHSLSFEKRCSLSFDTLSDSRKLI